MSYTIKFHTKWSDFDANKHMRHTAYNDYAAECRVRFLSENGFGLKEFEELNIGPVLFSENTIFRKEIKLGEDISVKLFLQAVSKNGERFKMFHKLYNEKGELAAEITIFAAWLNLETRKLSVPPKQVLTTLNSLEKTTDFEKIQLKK